MNETDPLENLRDIHLPPAVEGWPPAIGWWLVGATVVVMLVLLYLWLARRRRRFAWRRVALAALPDPRDRDTRNTAYYAELNRILKRAARVAYPGAGTDHMSGDDWQRFLSQKAPPEGQGDFVALTQAPYQPEAAISPRQAHDLTRDWLRSQPC